MGLMSNAVVISFAVVGVIWAWKVLNWVWLTPKKLEKCLRRQGFNGNSYKILLGDLIEIALMFKESKSKPINLSDDIVPKVLSLPHEIVRKYGKNSIIWLGPKPVVLVMEPEYVKEILSKNYLYQKDLGNPVIRFIATGLLSYDGEKWAKHRKILNPAFNQEKIKSMLPAFQSSCSVMVDKWEAMLSTKGSCELDVWPHLQAFTSDVISRTAFGTSYEEGRRIFQLQKEQADHIMQAIGQIYIPGYRLLPTARNLRMKKIDEEVQTTVRSIIGKRMKAIEAGEASNDDLLGLLLESNFKEIKQHGNKDYGMTIEEVIDECKLFHFGGQETTSSMLVWTMILLSTHQDWQLRAREEVRQVFGNSKPDFDGLNRLKIVTMIFYEVLRLYPPIFAFVRTIQNDTKLGEANIPAGVMLVLPVLLLHHDPDIWGNDAKDFKPERFTEGVSKATNGQLAYIPFGWGPRICIGQNFAMLEAKMVMAMILQRFSFELSPSYSHTPYAVMTIQPRQGAHLILNKL